MFQTATDISLNVTSPLDLGPGATYELRFDVLVPPNSSHYGVLDVSAPVDKSAVMTVKSVTLVSAYMDDIVIYSILRWAI